MSRVVTELARAGLIERQANPNDRRSSFAAITPEGRRRLRKAAPVYLSTVEQHFLSHLDDDEIGVLTRALTKVLGAEES